MKIVIAYEKQDCNICNQTSGREEVSSNPHDVYVIKNEARLMREIANTILLFDLRMRRLRRYRYNIPKPYLKKIIKWSTGVVIQRPIKQRKFIYICSHVLHQKCDESVRLISGTPEGKCPICNTENNPRTQTAISARAVLRFI